MSKILIRANWTFQSPLHVGTGLSRPAFADRIVRRAAEGTAEIDGEEIKGATRLSAERLCRWYSSFPAENNESSAPAHPLLKRVFSNSGSVRYRFRPAAAANVARFRSAATAIDTPSGVALTKTLRIVENFAGGAIFNIVIEAAGGEVDTDLRFLILSLILTSALGGKRTSGLGDISCSDVRYMIGGQPGVPVSPQIAAAWVSEVTHAIKAEEPPQ